MILDGSRFEWSRVGERGISGVVFCFDMRPVEVCAAGHVCESHEVLCVVSNLG